MNNTTPPLDPLKETNTKDAGDANEDIHMQMNAQDLAGIDLEKLEESLDQRDL
jgi:hypothetical protein